MERILISPTVWTTVWYDTFDCYSFAGVIWSQQVIVIAIGTVISGPRIHYSPRLNVRFGVTRRHRIIGHMNTTYVPFPMKDQI